MKLFVKYTFTYRILSGHVLKENLSNISLKGYKLLKISTCYYNFFFRLTLTKIFVDLCLEKGFRVNI